MVAPITTLAQAQQYVLVNGLYYNLADLGGDNAIIELQQKHPQHLIVRDHFLDEFMQKLREHNLPCNALPLTDIPDLFIEGISTGGFDATIPYVFDPDNGRLWEEASLISFKAARKAFCPITRKPLNYSRLIQHPFAVQLAEAINTAKLQNLDCIDLDQVFSAAVSGTLKLEAPAISKGGDLTAHANFAYNTINSFQNNFNLRQIHNEYNRREGVVVIFMSFLTIILIGLIFSSGIAALALFPAILFSTIMLQHMKTSRQIHQYMSQHQAALLHLGVKPRSGAFLKTFNLIAACSAVISIPAVALGIFLGFFYYAPAAVANRPERKTSLTTAYALWRTKHTGYTIQPVPTEIKRAVALRTAARVGIIAGIVGSVYFLPIVGLGLASTLLGPIGAGIFCFVVAAIILRFVLNDYISMRLNQLSPMVEAIEATQEYQTSRISPTPANLKATADAVKLKLNPQPQPEFKHQLTYIQAPELDALQPPTFQPPVQPNSAEPTSPAVKTLTLVNSYMSAKDNNAADELTTVKLENAPIKAARTSTNSM